MRCASVAVKAPDHPRHPEEPPVQVHLVAGLLHERAAAVDGPPAAVRGAVVVGLLAEELHGQVGGEQPPELPASIRAFTAALSGLMRRWKLTPRVTPGRTAGLDGACPRPRAEISSGFSVSTCRPSRAASRMPSWCSPLGVARITASKGVLHVAQRRLTSTPSSGRASRRGATASGPTVTRSRPGELPAAFGSPRRRCWRCCPSP